MEIESTKAISLKRLVGSAKAPPAGETAWLFRVYGCCVAVETGEGDKGEWTRYRGDFLAQTLLPVGRDQQVRAARAGEMYLPAAAEELMTAAGITADEEGSFHDLGLKVGIATDAAGKSSYVAEWLVKPAQSSPAERLVSEHAPDMLGKAPAASQTPAKKK